MDGLVTAILADSDSQLFFSGARGVVEFVLLYIFLHGLDRRRSEGVTAAANIGCAVVNAVNEMYVTEYSLYKLFITFGLIFVLVWYVYRIRWQYMVFCVLTFLLNRSLCMMFGFAATYEAFGIHTFDLAITVDGHFINAVRVPLQVAVRLATILLTRRFFKIDSSNSLTTSQLAILAVPMLVNYIVLRILADTVDAQGIDPSYDLVWALLLCGLSSFFLSIVTDSFFQTLRVRAMLENRKWQMDTQYREFQLRQQNDAEICSIYHDMSN